MKPSRLPPDRWRRIDEVLDAALGTPPAERAKLLEEECAGDDALRAEVEALLKAQAPAEAMFGKVVSPIGARILEAPEDAIPEDRRVGRFRVLREIGRGGMGVVYLAEDTRLGRKVALKVLPAYLGAGAEARRRFVAEARAVSSLDHPNVATLHEIDATEDGQLFMVFAYYPGETLADRIPRGPLAPAEAVRLTIQVAEGLAAAHGRNIVHRDVKPSNLLLTEDGAVKLLDFGVAKVAGEDLTGSGARLGTASFMSPEQARGAPLDGRADLWSLGVVLYEMLTGARPFRGSDPVAVIRSILHDEPAPPASLRPDLPEGFAQVMDKLLCKEPEDRYQRAEDLLIDLRALQLGDAPPVAEERPPPRQRAVHRPSVERLAVIPLENLTGEGEHAYFVDGIHGGLIGELGKIKSISVISRTSTLRFRDAELSLPDIAAELGVDALVEGSVQREEDTFSLDVRLVAASPEHTLWSERYHAGIGRAFAIAGLVARSIASEIGATLGPAEQRRRATGEDPTVLDLYYRGRYSLDRRTREGYLDAQRFLQQAIELDPDFAPAYGLLAEAIGQTAFFGLIDPRAVLPRVEELIRTALAIDPTAAPVYSAKAHVSLFWGRDPLGAEEAARKAIELNPSYAPAYWTLSEVLSVQQRDLEALDAAEAGSALELFTPFSKLRPVVALQHQRDFERAIEKALEGEGVGFYPEVWQGPWLHSLSLAGAGRLDEAIPWGEQAVEISGRTPMAVGALGYIYALAGRRGDAIRLASELETRAENGREYVGASYVAMTYSGLCSQDRSFADRAFAWLYRALEERDVTLIHLADQAFWDPVSADPRFGFLLGEMGLTPRSREGERLGGGAP
jgi:serine/threonine protein kinase